MIQKKESEDELKCNEEKIKKERKKVKKGTHTKQFYIEGTYTWEDVQSK